jgi:predicted nicotinamide N-methyase
VYEIGYTHRSENVSICGWTLCLAVLDDDDLLDAVGWDGPRNPYFGQVWPAAIALAAHLVGGGDVAGRSVLDLGCGPGLAGILAARLGGRVTFADVMPEALALAGRNAEANGVRGELLTLDFTKPRAARRFELVLAGDLLYEPGQAEALAPALRALLAQGGLALVADPLRPHADAFAEVATAAGLTVRTIQVAPRMRIFEVR